MSDNREVRIDKWLWAVRVFKTRSMAADACKKNRITIRDNTAKPSSMIKEDDIIKVRKPPITYTYRVKKILESRVGAKLVSEYLENLTPESEFEILKLQKMSGFVNREKGLGRPTKKDRRELDSFVEMDDFDEWWDNDEDSI